MRDFTLVQDIAASVDVHWRTVLDRGFGLAIAEALAFREYEVFEEVDTETELRRKTRAVPKLPSALAKVFGDSFGYLEEGTFDKAEGIWRARTIPNTFSDRMFCDLVMRAEPGDTPDTCRRTLDFHVEARVLGIGSMLESSFEKQLRRGWQDNADFTNDWLRRMRAA